MKKQQDKLFDACRKGNIDDVEALLQQGIDIKGRNNYGYTCLDEAGMSGNIEIVQLLIGNSRLEPNLLQTLPMYLKAYLNTSNLAIAEYRVRIIPAVISTACKSLALLPQSLALTCRQGLAGVINSRNMVVEELINRTFSGIRGNLSEHNIARLASAIQADDLGLAKEKKEMQEGLCKKNERLEKILSKRKDDDVDSVAHASERAHPAIVSAGGGGIHVLPIEILSQIAVFAGVIELSSTSNVHGGVGGGAAAAKC
jgi:hypothetical protein